MIRIDKSVYRKDFDEYSKEFLKNKQIQKGVQSGKFIVKFKDPICFKKFFSDKRYKYTSIPQDSRFRGWFPILLQETGGRCCYCMRQLPTDEVSIEHLVPETLEGLSDSENYNFYAGLSSDIRDYVISGAEFDEQSKKQHIDVNTLTRFPHLIAHSNLFPACRDSLGCSCNHRRGNKKILPMMLMDGIESIVEYAIDGHIKLKYTDVSVVITTFENLKINNDTLVQIRHLWYLFSRRQINPTTQNALTKDQMKTFIEQAFDGNVDNDYKQYYENDYYRTLVLQYNWFYDYYLKQYPIQS